MKKFHFLDGLKIGGIENQALTLSSLETSKVENFLINLNKRRNDYPDNFFNQKKYKNLKVISFERKQGLLISFIIFKKFRKYKNSDFIIYFNNMTSLWVIIGAKFAGISNIAICIQNSIIGNFKENFKTIILIKIFNQFKVKLVPCSKAVLTSYLKIDKNIKFSNVIPNCIDVKNFQREVKMIKKNRKLGKLKIISMIARLDEIKDQETLIRAYSKVKKKCRLLLIGDGKKKSKLEKIALSLNLEPKEIFLGSRNDIHNILANSDIFAFSTTDAEGFGIVILEAMAAGLPIIATDVSACREVLDNGDSGILVPINREDIWVKEITNLLNSKKLRDNYINKSAKNIQKYDFKNIVLKWNNIFLK